MEKAKKNWIPILIILLGGVFLFSVGMVIHTLTVQGKEKAAFNDLSALVAAAEEKDRANKTSELSESSVVSTTPAPKTDPVPLPMYASLYEKNADFFGWISIADTEINYPVMYSLDRPEYYLRRAFDGSDASSGVPFIDGNCPADGNYYLIYGHHMKNKTMFGQLPQYAEQSFFEEHPTIRFDTLYEQRKYQVIAAFYSRIYGEGEQGFRYYQYTDLTDSEIFEEYMTQVKAAALYDTGCSAEYGDDLLTLSTCNYHTADGRFVVVAKRINESE